jgi:hypothetical protein
MIRITVLSILSISLWYLGVVSIFHISPTIMGPEKCRKAFSIEHPKAFQLAVETENMMMRTIDDHWVAGLVMQPKNINESEYTVICRFEG